MISALKVLLSLHKAPKTSITKGLPKLSDANREGLCWWWRTDADNSKTEGQWELLQFDFAVFSYNSRCDWYKYTHWAPYWAIPNPDD